MEKKMDQQEPGKKESVVGRRAQKTTKKEQPGNGWTPKKKKGKTKE